VGSVVVMSVSELHLFRLIGLVVGIRVCIYVWYLLIVVGGSFFELCCNSVYVIVYNNIVLVISRKLLKLHHPFCITGCTKICKPPCNIHQQSYTLLPNIISRLNQSFFHNPLPTNNPSTHQNFQNH
jgi:hypothetical protein